MISQLISSWLIWIISAGFLKPSQRGFCGSAKLHDVLDAAESCTEGSAPCSDTSSLLIAGSVYKDVSGCTDVHLQHLQAITATLWMEALILLSASSAWQQGSLSATLQINNVSSSPNSLEVTSPIPISSSVPQPWWASVTHCPSAKFLPVCVGGTWVENAAVPGHRLLRICVTQGSPTPKGRGCQAPFGLQGQPWQGGRGFSRVHGWWTWLCPFAHHKGHGWGISLPLNAWINALRVRLPLWPGLAVRRGKDCHSHVCWHKPVPGVEMLAGEFDTTADRAMQGWRVQRWLFDSFLDLSPANSH